MKKNKVGKLMDMKSTVSTHAWMQSVEEEHTTTHRETTCHNQMQVSILQKVSLERKFALNAIQKTLTADLSKQDELCFFFDQQNPNYRKTWRKMFDCSGQHVTNIQYFKADNIFTEFHPKSNSSSLHCHTLSKPFR